MELKDYIGRTIKFQWYEPRNLTPDTVRMSMEYLEKRIVESLGLTRSQLGLHPISFDEWYKRQNASRTRTTVAEQETAD
jgi:hypothetical protein